MTSKTNRGFSLIEVMLVVTILGVIATLAYPNLRRNLIQARQIEAKTNLSAIHAAQKVYYATNQGYAPSLNLLNIEIGTEGALYSYSIALEGNGFVATATGNIDQDETDDIWTIDQDKQWVNSINDVIE